MDNSKKDNLSTIDGLKITSSVSSSIIIPDQLPAQPYLETILKDLYTPGPKKPEQEIWAEPNEENLRYIINLSYMSEVFRVNPYLFLSLVTDKFPKMPINLLQSLFHNPPSSIPADTSNPLAVQSYKPSKRFTSDQLAAMMKRYEKSPTIGIHESKILADEIGLSPKQVRSWFDYKKYRRNRKTRRNGKVDGKHK